jgi:hypothetical protein
MKKPEWPVVKCEKRMCSFLRPRKQPCHTPVATRLLLSTRHAEGLVLTAYSKVMSLYLNGGAHPPNCTKCYLQSHSCSLAR